MILLIELLIASITLSTLSSTIPWQHPSLPLVSHHWLVLRFGVFCCLDDLRIANQFDSHRDGLSLRMMATLASRGSSVSVYD